MATELFKQTCDAWLLSKGWRDHNHVPAEIEFDALARKVVVSISEAPLSDLYLDIDCAATCHTRKTIVCARPCCHRQEPQVQTYALFLGGILTDSVHGLYTEIHLSKLALIGFVVAIYTPLKQFLRLPPVIRQQKT